MVDLTAEMAGLWAALGPAPAHRGRVLQFVAATSGEGTSTVAREFARLAAVRARRPVWLVDADLTGQGQQEAVSAQSDRFGRLAKPSYASPDGSCFFTVSPRLTAKDGRPVPAARLLLAQACLGGRLWVTRLRTDALRAGQRIEALPDARYWDAMRKHAETVVVDAPSLDRSDLCITLAPYMDATIIVVAAETTRASEPIALRDEIEAVGGRIAGVVMNRSTYQPPGLLRKVLG